MGTGTRGTVRNRHVFKHTSTKGKGWAAYECMRGLYESVWTPTDTFCWPLVSADGTSHVSPTGAGRLPSSRGSGASASMPAPASLAPLSPGWRAPRYDGTLPLLVALTQDDPARGMHFMSALEAFKSRTAYANTGGCGPHSHRAPSLHCFLRSKPPRSEGRAPVVNRTAL